jgi:L-ascorbate metabolism protein UlaG (beta-lactamase superfamily)
MKLRIYHTVNEGLYIWNGKSGLLIDALHGGREAGFSATPDRYIQMMRKRQGFFGQSNDLLFTHTHGDHYDPQLVREFLEINPDSSIYAPGLDSSNMQPVVLEEGIGRLQIREYTIYVVTTEHDGKQYAGYPHVSYLICWEGQSLWISGDALLVPELAERIRQVSGQTRVDAAFVMIYQAGSKEGRTFLEQLSPERIYLYHLPYAEEDPYHYHRTAGLVVEKCKRKNLSVTILQPDHFIED